MEDYYDYLEADDIALREMQEQEDLEFLERELLDLEIKLEKILKYCRDNLYEYKPYGLEKNEHLEYILKEGE